MTLEPFLTISPSFVTGVLVGGVIGGVLGVLLTRPREETKISYEQRGWILKDLVKVETQIIRWLGITVSTNTKKDKVAQRVDMETIGGLRREAEIFTHRVLRFLPFTNGLRKLFGRYRFSTSAYCPPAHD